MEGMDSTDRGVGDSEGLQAQRISTSLQPPVERFPGLIINVTWICFQIQLFYAFSISVFPMDRQHDCATEETIIGHRSAPAHSPLASEADAALDDFPIAHPLLSTGTLFSLNPLLSCNISYIL